MEQTQSNVYSAIYSGVPVYEAVIHEVPVMRRMADHYMNATQILKIAGFSKPKRTKILETDVLQGIHEKIQGGYGKYQGTWIPLDAGRQLAIKYGIESALAPILDFDPDTDFLGQKPAVKRVPRVKPVVTDEAPEIEETIVFPPTITDGQTVTPSRSRNPSTASALGSPVRTSVPTQQEPTPLYAQVKQDLESPPIAARILFDEENTQRDFFESVYARKRTKTNESNEIEHLDIPRLEALGLSPSERQHSILMHLFVEDDSDYSASVFLDLVKSTPTATTIDVDLVLDKNNGTLLHWAASCGRIKVVKLLISHGAKINKPADNGVTPLMKALEFTRNYSLQTMEPLLSLLGPSLFTADSDGKTALHYANALSKYRSKREVSSYYMECIAAYIEDTRSATNSPFIAFIDSVDNQADSALHIACRYKNHKNVALLLNLGASKDLENSANETPMSLSSHDFRLQQLMLRPSPFHLPEFDNYDDAPTTPMSDYTDTSVGETDQSTAINLLKRKDSSSSFNGLSFNDAHSRLVHKKATRHVSGAKSELNELKYYKDRFALVQKHAEKIKKAINTPFSAPMDLSKDLPKTPINGTAYSHKTMMAETRLSSQLIRLESLVNASLAEQNDLLSKLERLQTERDLKDKRYVEMLATICHVSVEVIEEVLTKSE